jgi:hypothetical protein
MSLSINKKWFKRKSYAETMDFPIKNMEFHGIPIPLIHDFLLSFRSLAPEDQLMDPEAFMDALYQAKPWTSMDPGSARNQCFFLHEFTPSIINYKVFSSGKNI